MTDKRPFVRPLADCGDDVADEVGGKAVGLGFLIAEGLTVPAGFVVTVDAFRQTVGRAGLQPSISAVLDRHEPDADMSQQIIALFSGIEMPDDIAQPLKEAYEQIGGGPVAVRSSALAEDTAEASFAGQQDTYLWIEGIDAVRNAVLRCWASLYTRQAIGYRRRFNVAPENVAMAVVVQTMVPAVAAGVTLTLDPMTGDSSHIYIESALGLGEGVVKGVVETDSAWIDKSSLEVVRTAVGKQTRAHRFESGEVRLVDLAPAEGDGPALSSKSLRDVAGLARRVEQFRGQAMDIEWALDDSGAVHLLQARPETVWSNDRSASENAMHLVAGGRATWTTTNTAENSGSTLTPLGASLVVPAGEYGFRYAFYTIGALSRPELETPPEVDDRILGYFFGQSALNLSLLCRWADRIPGTSGLGMAEQIFSHVPHGYRPRSMYQYYPRVLAKVAIPFVRYPALVRADRREMDAFWRAAQRQLLHADAVTARRLLIRARAAFVRSIALHITLTMGAVQPAYEQLDRLAGTVGMSALSLMSGHGGHEESAVLDDVWNCAQGRLALDEFLFRHGYHGPNEAEVSTTVWREDPKPVVRLIESYREKARAPNADAKQRAEHRERLEAEFLAALPRAKRLMGRAMLGLAGRYVPMRGIGKVSFLQGIDIVRAAARRLGTHFVETGAIDAVDDVFMLTIDELAAGLPADARELIAERRRLYHRYQAIDLPANWRGVPTPVTMKVDHSAEVIEGTGASPGIVEGTVRVVLDPSAATIHDDEILVAKCTDPSWAALMFLSAGLIADIGGVMSHTAVVARELRIPCVVNTKCASQVLNDGDRVRMDGSSGLVEILSRA